MNKGSYNLKRRYRKEVLFRSLGLLTIILTLSALVFMLVSISLTGLPALIRTDITLSLDLSDPSFAQPKNADYRGAINRAMYALFPEAKTRQQKRALRKLISRGAPFNLRDQFLLVPEEQRTSKNIQVRVVADDLVNLYAKGQILRSTSEGDRLFKNQSMDWVDKLTQMDRVEQSFNTFFFTHGTSREPEQAGILAALVGSLIMLLIAFVITLPIGIAASIYLEEFAPENRFTNFIEANINNLAAVPSIIFGLLGLAIFINFFQVPRSTPLVGGLVLALMTLPTIIIASRAAIKAVPPSIREGALALGASPVQVVLHHVLPLSMPGMLTGSVIGMAQALGETAPLLIVGMVAFVVDVPQSITSPATALPVQIYLWAGNPETSFISLAAAAIMVLIITLLFINSFTVYLRKKMERPW